MNIYVSAIGGVGMGPLAMLAIDAGHNVSGSDLQESAMTELLRQKGAQVYIGQDGSQITEANQVQKIDWFVYSAALAPDHAELQFAREHNIKISKRDAFLNQILGDKNLKMIAIAGTHGKTTTTGMLIWLFKQLSVPVSYLIGTTISFGPPAQYISESEWFIYEADEFDRNFLSYKPEVSLVVSLDYDHPDTYPTKQAYIDAFQQFIRQSHMTITWRSIVDLVGIEVSDNIIGLDDSHDLSALHLSGEHNRRNAFLVVTTASAMLGEQIDPKKLLDYIEKFPGTSRRFEKLADNLYTDYAHHPAEIEATIQMALELNRSVVVVYQPHQNIRQHEIMQEGSYKDCFAGAEQIYWLPTYLSREDKNLETLTPGELISSLSNASKAVQAEMNDELWQHIEQARSSGKLVLCMSAGDLDPWLRQHIC